MVYFIGDTHFGHSNVLRLCNRPFNNVEEMNQFIIDSWKSRVTNEDDVYILGDVAYKSQTDIVKILKSLPGKKHLVTGNHDRKNLKNQSFASCFVEVKDLQEIVLDNKRIILCHFPLGEWDGYYRGAYHIHGHIHNNTSIKVYQFLKQEERALNAGVDIINYAPATFEELVAYNQVFKSTH
jgi:calcineurin-like phosphoesterase family protein